MASGRPAFLTWAPGGGWTGVRWAAFQFGWMLALAYGSALLVYQGGRALGWG